MNLDTIMNIVVMVIGFVVFIIPILLVVLLVVWVIAIISQKRQHYYKVANCRHCGKPFRGYYASTDYVELDELTKHLNYLCVSICSCCRDEYSKLLKIEMQKQPKTKKCAVCCGSGKTKGYRCMQCRGSGFVTIDDSLLVYKASHLLKRNYPEWKKTLWADGNPILK